MAILVQETTGERKFNVMTTVMWPVKFKNYYVEGEKTLHLFKNVPEKTARGLADNIENISDERVITFPIPGKRKDGNERELVITFSKTDNGKIAQINEKLENASDYYFFMDVDDLYDVANQLRISLDQPQMYTEIIG